MLRGLVDAGIQVRRKDRTIELPAKMVRNVARAAEGIVYRGRSTIKSGSLIPWPYNVGNAAKKAFNMGVDHAFCRGARRNDEMTRHQLFNGEAVESEQGFLPVEEATSHA
jgi:hypothetical protein